MKKILTIFFVLTSLFFMQNASADDFSSLRKTGVAKVSEVLNPLTIKLEDGRIVHLAGLDFPDLDFYEAGDLSITAQKILKDFLTNRKVVIYQTKSKDKGRMNRMGHHIAHLVRADDNIWTQGLLISLGVARVRTTKYNPEMADQMLKLEEKARKNKSGMWNMDKHQVLSPEQTQEYIGSYQIVEGRVHNASMRKNKLYLNFGNNWRDDFTVAISALNLKQFIKKKIDPKSWNGKLIRVRGWISSYNGPYMEIDHPERFEALFEQKNKTNENEDMSIQKRPRNKKDKGSALPVVND